MHGHITSSQLHNMAYNLRSRLTSASEGSSGAPRSEGMDLSPVELVVPMSEQSTAGHGPDLLGPIVIEGSPEALQTVAISAPITSQAISGTVAGPDASLGVADIGDDDGQAEILNTTIIHPASSVCGAGAAGSGPPPSGPGAAPSTISSFRDPSIVPFSSYLTLNNTVTLKSGLEVIRGH